MENRGTSCFVNSTINALFSLPSVFSFLTERSVMPCLKAGRGALYLELRRLAMWQGSRPANSDMVRQLVGSMFPARGFENGQHDAAEFMIALIGALKGEFMPGSESEIKLEKMFQSVITSNLTCLNTTCPRAGAREIGATVDDSKKGPVISLGKHESSMVNAINTYLKGEVLEVRCPTCRHPRASRSTSKWEVLPQNLLIALPRFMFDEKTVTTRKNNQSITVPNKLEINSVKFSLTAAVEHLGTQASNGHYFTYSKSFSTGQYTLCNDSSIEEAMPDLKKAYLVVY